MAKEQVFISTAVRSPEGFAAAPLRVIKLQDSLFKIACHTLRAHALLGSDRVSVQAAAFHKSAE
jgi:hypothetical protein